MSLQKTVHKSAEIKCVVMSKMENCQSLFRISNVGVDVDVSNVTALHGVSVLLSRPHDRKIQQ